MKLKECREAIVKILDQYSVAGEINNVAIDLNLADSHLKIDNAVNMALNQVHMIHPFTDKWHISGRKKPKIDKTIWGLGSEYLSLSESFAYTAYAECGEFTVIIEAFLKRDKLMPYVREEVDLPPFRIVLGKSLVRNEIIADNVEIARSIKLGDYSFFKEEFENTRLDLTLKDYENILIKVQSRYFTEPYITIYRESVLGEELESLPVVIEDKKLLYRKPYSFLKAERVNNLSNSYINWCVDGLEVTMPDRNGTATDLEIDYAVRSVSLRDYEDEIMNANQFLKVKKGLENAVVYYAAAMMVTVENPVLHNSLLRNYQESLANYNGSSNAVGKARIRVQGGYGRV